VVLKNTAGLLLALVRSDHEMHGLSPERARVGLMHIPMVIEAGGIETLVILGAKKVMPILSASFLFPLLCHDVIFKCDASSRQNALQALVKWGDP